MRMTNSSPQNTFGAAKTRVLADSVNRLYPLLPPAARSRIIHAAMATNQSVCRVCNGDLTTGDEEKGICAFCRIFGYAAADKSGFSPSGTPTANLSTVHPSSTISVTTPQAVQVFGQQAKPNAGDATTAPASTTVKIPNTPDSMRSMMPTLPIELQNAFLETPLPTGPSAAAKGKGKERETSPAPEAEAEQDVFGTFSIEDFCFCEGYCLCGKGFP
ncbi:MAG: hypothetical protein Q9168_003880 [Polycauliona sp. 1 TL-2023]